jgi:copper homeostasis protein
MIFEVCIDTVEGAVAAQAAGAQRVELCDNLVEGGTTPSLGMIQVVRGAVTMGVNIIIRPRGGDFYYSEHEFAVMKADILAAKAAGADGVVIGLLNRDGSVDIERTRELAALARPMRVTFHRAFDMTRSPAEALEAICALGIDRVLTSGQKDSALKGMPCIAKLVEQAGERTIILVGGGVNADNVAQIVAGTGVKEVHFGASRIVESPMEFRNPGCTMGKDYQPNEYSRKEADLEKIRQIISAAEGVERV